MKLRKQTLIIFAVLSCQLNLVFAQSVSLAPQAFNYQGLARDSSGNPLVNKTIGLRITISKSYGSDSIEYVETHQPTTNQFGMFAIHIGLGTPTFQTFADIPWWEGPQFFSVELDVSGGTNYSFIGTQQIVSVPYAMVAGALILQSGKVKYKVVPNGATVKTVELPCDPQPNVPNAGSNVVLSSGDTSVVLSANSPDSNSVGTWSKYSHTGGSYSFSDIHDPNATFYGEIGNSYVLSWTIGTDCRDLTDQIDVTIQGGVGVAGSDFVDPRDGQVYPTVHVDGVRWMAKNMNYYLPNSGYYQNDSVSYSDPYGRYYNWATATTSVCPAGWHLPSLTEYNDLKSYISPSAGGNMKATGTSYWDAPNTGATNTSLFNAVGAGWSNSTFDNWAVFNEETYIWTATEDDAFSAYAAELTSTSASLSFPSWNKNKGYSVRCVED